MKKGETMSDELKQKLSNAKKGKVFSAEHRANLSKSHLGKIPTNLNQLISYRKGRPLTEEHKLKIKLGNIGKTRSSETRERISLSLVGRVPKNKGVGIKTYKCSFCKEEYKTKTRNRKYCSENCFRESNKGENNYRYIKDRSKIVGRHNRNFHDSEMKQWRAKVYRRDSYKCKINNKECKGRIEAHHIKTWKEHPELRYTVTNGITLCHFHHPRTRKAEKNLESCLQSLVS